MSIKIKELPVSERPYEKLEIYGAKKLSNSELLAIIIKTGTQDETAVDLARKILNLQGENNTNSLRFLQELTLEDYMKIKGIGKIKAIQLKAVCEIAKRITTPIDLEKNIIRSPQDVATIFIDELRFEKREILKVVMLNIKNRIIKISDVFIGGTNSIIVQPKDILYEAIKLGSPKIILIHNHPSGDPTPSKSDYQMTERLEKSAELIGIELVDHIVIGDGKYESIFSNRMIKKF